METSGMPEAALVVCMGPLETAGQDIVRNSCLGRLDAFGLEAKGARIETEGAAFAAVYFERVVEMLVYSLDFEVAVACRSAVG